MLAGYVLMIYTVYSTSLSLYTRLNGNMQYIFPEAGTLLYMYTVCAADPAYALA